MHEHAHTHTHTYLYKYHYNNKGLSVYNIVFELSALKKNRFSHVVVVVVVAFNYGNIIEAYIITVYNNNILYPRIVLYTYVLIFICDMWITAIDVLKVKILEISRYHFSHISFQTSQWTVLCQWRYDVLYAVFPISLRFG